MNMMSSRGTLDFLRRPVPEDSCQRLERSIPAQSQIIVAQNWVEELTRLVPVP